MLVSVVVALCVSYVVAGLLRLVIVHLNSVSYFCLMLL